MGHTKGSFTVIAANVPGTYVVSEAIDRTTPLSDPARLVEHEANARLLSAAPEMLEALKRLQHWAEVASCKMLDSDNWPATLALKKAAEAIAKAEGREEK